MFERFTDGARRVVVQAQEEARLGGHNHIGTEHLLLALSRDRENLAARVLLRLGVSLDQVRTEALRQAAAGGATPNGSLPFTPEAKTAIEKSLVEARALGHDYIGSEHLLLGVLAEGDGVGAQVLLQDMGVTIVAAREAVRGLLGDLGAKT